MLGGDGGGGMTVPHGDLETTLRRELTAAVDGVEPAPDALERIRAKTAVRPPQPWLLTVASGAVSRARYWVWHGHWAWPESLPRPRAVSWPAAGWAARVKRATGGDWLRPVAVLAGVAFIAIVALAVPPLRQAIGHVTSNVLTGGQTSGGAGTDGHGTQDGGGGGTLTNGAHNTTGTNPIGPGNTTAPGWKAAPQCQPPAISATPTGSSEQIAAAVSSALPVTTATATACPSPTATATGSPTPTATASPTPTATATGSPTPTATATGSPTPTDTTSGSPTPTDTGTGSPTASPSDTSSAGSTTVGGGTLGARISHGKWHG
jgi:hypothetical protein